MIFGGDLKQQLHYFGIGFNRVHKAAKNPTNIFCTLIQPQILIPQLHPLKDNCKNPILFSLTCRVSQAGRFLLATCDLSIADAVDLTVEYFPEIMLFVHQLYVQEVYMWTLGFLLLFCRLLKS